MIKTIYRIYTIFYDLTREILLKIKQATCSVLRFYIDKLIGGHHFKCISNQQLITSPH
jgi:hypothetical protein